jgi:hypothetical protein
VFCDAHTLLEKSRQIRSKHSKRYPQKSVPLGSSDLAVTKAGEKEVLLAKVKGTNLRHQQRLRPLHHGKLDGHVVP